MESISPIYLEVKFIFEFSWGNQIFSCHLVWFSKQKKNKQIQWKFWNISNSVKYCEYRVCRCTSLTLSALVSGATPELGFTRDKTCFGQLNGICEFFRWSLQRLHRDIIFFKLHSPGFGSWFLKLFAEFRKSIQSKNRSSPRTPFPEISCVHGSD